MNYRKYLALTAFSSEQVLGQWRWLTGPDLELWHVTKAGDAFLKKPADGSVYFLDVVAGRVEMIADSEIDFEALISDVENADCWLMPSIVDGQALLGMEPGNDECLSMKQPPVLGGQVTPDNFETCCVLVHFSIAGQIHEQVKDLPPGTKIDKIQIKSKTRATKRPWWKFWDGMRPHLLLFACS
ncbi:MAG TPA: T6SS immunity protein Tdi1 domain-containing protein [Pirellulales bacterium]|nr:T6SS immunity protein Tdi1 domain-containing protein [Pirellulales bacterium]